MSNFTFKSVDNREIYVHKWLPDGKPIGVIQIAHGMAEHGGRYEPFAKEMNASGYAVYVNDHRGHGKSSTSVDRQGYLGGGEGASDGFSLLVEDMYTLTQIVRKEYPNLPIFIVAHSMGSFAAQKYIMDYESVDGVILMGSNGESGTTLKLGRMLCKLEMARDKDKKSKRVNNLVFGKYNDKVENRKTGFDWLTRDRMEVRKYAKDPYCGRMFPASFFRDFITGMIYVENKKNFSKIPTDLPIYILAGDKDPVGQYGKGVEKLYNRYKMVGVRDVEMKLYPDARHELLNEICREEVIDDIQNWLKKRNQNT